jgi:hypothetical protein
MGDRSIHRREGWDPYIGFGEEDAGKQQKLSVVVLEVILWK